MQRPPTNQGNNRFKASMRHYHRAGSPENRTWDEWIDGSPAGSRTPRRRWWKITGITMAVLALGGIIAGLVIELG